MATLGIVASTSLLEFAKIHGKMKIAKFVNKKSGEVFKSCAFINSEGKITLVAFSSNLGELSSAEIIKQKYNLQVVKLASGTYKLCKSNDTWEDVDL